MEAVYIHGIYDQKHGPQTADRQPWPMLFRTPKVLMMWDLNSYQRLAFKLTISYNSYTYWVTSGRRCVGKETFL